MFAARANPSGIDKKEAFTLPFVLDVDGIPRGARDFAYDCAPIAEQRINQR